MLLKKSHPDADEINEAGMAIGMPEPPFSI
jgi:hypothetical protein